MEVGGGVGGFDVEPETKEVVVGEGAAVDTEEPVDPGVVAPLYPFFETYSMK